MISIPSERLPNDPAALDIALREYFAFDLHPEWRINGDVVEVELVAPPTVDFYIDPLIAEGLAWWSGEIGVTDIPAVRRELGAGLLFLNDAWTLLSWSRWLARRSDQGVDDEVTILHVDDHEDLMSPRLILDGDELINAITGERVDVAEPASVDAAIRTGSIGMGSFFVPFLRRVPTSHVRHLRGRGPSVDQTPLTVTYQPDTLLRPGQLRPKVSRELADASARGTYMRTTDPRSWANDGSDNPILLHIDMDYFNNRFDGDSDWGTDSKGHDPELDVVLGAIDEMFDALAESGALARVEDIAIGISPAFFPAELWSLAVGRVIERAEAIPGRSEPR